MSRARLIGTAAGIAAVATLAFTYGNPFRTPAVKQIEQRYSAAGGTATHMPGVATPRGNESNISSPANQPSGPSSSGFKDNVSDQRKDTSTVTAKFREAHYGNPKGT